MAEFDQEEVADYQEDQDDYDEEYVENGDADNDAEPEEMKRRVMEMEDELEKLTKMQEQTEKQLNSALDNLDENSIYVGQVDYEASPEELRAHFAPCGTINRITIMVDKITGQPKGFAYIEFVDKESVNNALKLDDTPFKGRQLKVTPKRQTMSQSALRGGRGRGRGGFGGRFRGRGGRFSLRGRGGRRGGYRGRGRGSYQPTYY